MWRSVEDSEQLVNELQAHPLSFEWKCVVSYMIPERGFESPQFQARLHAATGSQHRPQRDHFAGPLMTCLTNLQGASALESFLSSEVSCRDFPGKSRNGLSDHVKIFQSSLRANPLIVARPLEAPDPAVKAAQASAGKNSLAIGFV